MFNKGDVVLYHGERYKVDNVKLNNGKELLKIHSTRGKSNCVAYNVSSDRVTKLVKGK